LRTKRLEIDYAAVWVAELNGYFEQEGSRSTRPTNGPSALLDINNLDAVMAAIVPFMQYVARGGDVRIVMSVTKGNAPIVGKKGIQVGQGPRRQESRHAGGRDDS
jgi:ABC-type nitrate/sulfonate/bicarbonate transport system substrate-binding protein